MSAIGLEKELKPDNVQGASWIMAQVRVASQNSLIETIEKMDIPVDVH